MIVGHIGARKGSKGVKNKNFRSIAGKRLIDWSLEQLFHNSKIDVVVVSSDDDDIYTHSLEMGAHDIGLRPSYLATDNASKWDVWKHSLLECQKTLGNIEAFVDLDCTSPLRYNSDINNAINLFFKKKPDMVMSCCIAGKNPYFNLVEFNSNGGLMVSKPLKGNIVARQHAPIVYEHVASIYVVDPDYIHNSNFLYDGHVIPYLMPPERSLDIDSEFDFKLVEFLLSES